MARLHKIYALLEQNYKTTKIPDVACAYNTDSYTPPHLLLILFQNFLNKIVYVLCLHDIYYFILFLIKNTKYFSIRNSNAIGTDLKKIYNSVPYRNTIVGCFLPARKQTGVGKIRTFFYWGKIISTLVATPGSY